MDLHLKGIFRSVRLNSESYIELSNAIRRIVAREDPDTTVLV